MRNSDAGEIKAIIWKMGKRCYPLLPMQNLPSEGEEHLRKLIPLEIRLQMFMTCSEEQLKRKLHVDIDIDLSMETEDQ